jgi:hypothetical protein
MKNKFSSFCILLITILITNACQENEKQATSFPVNNWNEASFWADTIIYEVLIQNPDTLNNWENTKLKRVKTQKIVDDLFELIYNKEKVAYNYYTHKPMSINQIKKLEEDDEFSRKRVGKLQFTETWKYNKNTGKVQKKIHHILLAYEIYDSSNNLRGYKAAFYLKDF